jgi:hypothetical protein
MKFTCPNCAAVHELEPIAILNSEDKLVFSIPPEIGRRLSPLHVGGMMRSFERLLVAMEEEIGRAHV